MNVTQLLGFGGHQRLKVFKDTDCSVPGVTPLSESFFKPLLADQEPSLAGFSPQLCLFRLLEGALAWGPSLLFRESGT